MKKEILLTCDIEFLSPLLVGMSLDRARFSEDLPDFIKEERKKHNLNKNTLKDDKGSINIKGKYISDKSKPEFEDYFDINSLTGLIRTSAGWVLEYLNRAKNTNSKKRITCDYIYKDEEIPNRCILCGIFGTCNKNAQKKSDSFLPSSLEFWFLKNNGEPEKKRTNRIYGKTEGKTYNFAWAELNNKKSPLAIRYLDLKEEKNYSLQVKIKDNSFKDPGLSISLLCFALDMIGAGYFRAGRYGSRGYGWIRFSNYRLEKTVWKIESGAFERKVVESFPSKPNIKRVKEKYPLIEFSEEIVSIKKFQEGLKKLLSSEDYDREKDEILKIGTSYFSGFELAKERISFKSEKEIDVKNYIRKYL